MFKRSKWNIVRGDTVKILAGKDKGQVGTITKVIRDVRIPRVIVEGLNLNKRHIKRQETNPGGIVSVESPLHYSNVALVDPVTKKAVRVAKRFLEDGTKVRISRGKLASQSIIPKSDILLKRRKPNAPSGDKDTSRTVADEVTYKEGDLPTFGLQRMYCTAAAASGRAAGRLLSGNNLFCTGVRRWRSCPMGFAAMHL